MIAQAKESMIAQAKIEPLSKQVKYAYSAFISYRHVEPDRRWAMWLHRTLETYRVPKRLQRDRRLPRRLGRCFRDEEELPASSDLSTQIDRALSQSRFLIVICSRNTPQSRWVNQEVQRFRQLGRGHRILTLLIDGEPHEAFPKALVQVREAVAQAGGQTGTRIRSIEPLAADVREDKGTGHGRHHAKLRLIATILGVKFDDLRRRDQERRQRRLALLSATLLTLLLVISGLAGVAWYQRGQARRERVVAIHERNEADHQRTIADGQRQEADKQRAFAEGRLAQSLLSQGDALLRDSRGAEANARFAEARDVLLKLNRPTAAADLGWFEAYRKMPPPTLSFAAQLNVVAMCPDGRTAAIGAYNRVALRDLATGRELRRLESSDGHVGSLEVSDDGSSLLAGSAHLVQLWNLRTGALVRTFRGQDDHDIRGVHFQSHDQAWSVDSKGTYRLWELGTGTELRHFKVGADVGKACWSGDGRLCWIVGSRPTCLLVDMIQGKELRSEIQDGLSAETLAVSHDGHAILVGAADGTLSYRKLASGDELRRFHVNSAVTSAAFVTGDRFAWLSLADGTLRLWDLASGQTVGALSTTTPVSQIALTPDGRFLIGGGGVSSNVHIWDLRADEFPVVHNRPSYRSTLCVAPDGRSAFWSPDEEGRSLMMDVAAVTPTVVSARRVAYSGDSARMALETSSGIDIVSTTDGHHLNRLSPPVDGPPLFAWDAERQRLLFVGENNSVELFDYANGYVLHHFVGHTQFVEGLDLSPDGKLGVSCSSDGTTRIWDLVSGRELRTLRGNGHNVGSVRFSPDGHLLITTNVGGTADLWEVSSGRHIAELQGHLSWVSCAAFSPDGKLVATGSADGTVRVWDTASYKEIRVLEGYGGAVSQVSFCGTDGTKLACTGLAGWFAVWDFAQPHRAAEMSRAIPAAVAALSNDAQDPAALATLGEWYALRGSSDLACDCLAQAEAKGYAISHLTLARCQWRLGRLEKAGVEFDWALRGREAPEPYLLSCLAAVGSPRNAKGSQPVVVEQSSLPWLPPPASDPDRRAQVLLRRGQFSEAELELTAAIEYRPDDHMQWCRRAALRLYNGDLKGYREDCREMIRRFGSKDGAAPDVTLKLCLASPDSQVSDAVLEPTMDRVLKKEAGSSSFPWLALDKGMLEYRAHRYDSAVQWLRRATPVNESWVVLSRLFLAMAERQRGNASEAQIAYRAADAIMRRWAQPGRADLGHNLHDWLVSEAVRREARAVLQVAGPTTGSVVAASASDVPVPAGQSPLPRLGDEDEDVDLRSQMLMRRGQFREAESELTRALEQGPEDHMRWIRRAAVRLYLGDRDGYAKDCREMLRRFGSAGGALEIGERISKVCLVSPDSQIAPAMLTPIMDRVLNNGVGNDKVPWFALAKGMLEYRAGHYDSAVQWVQMESSSNSYCEALSDLFLAMAQQQRGDTVAAESALRAAKSLMSVWPRPGRSDLGDGNLHDLLYCEVILREAEAVVHGVSPKTTIAARDTSS